jgi:hypothetical protein
VLSEALLTFNRECDLAHAKDHINSWPPDYEYEALLRSGLHKRSASWRYSDIPHGQGLPIPDCTELAKEIYAEPNGENIDEVIKTLIQETDFAHLLPSAVEHSLFKKRFVERIKYHS